MPSCPNCGSHLASVMLGPATAPYLCARCRLGWWNAELTGEARKAWNPRTGAFDWHIHRDVIGPALVAERAQAGKGA